MQKLYIIGKANEIIRPQKSSQLRRANETKNWNLEPFGLLWSTEKQLNMPAKVRAENPHSLPQRRDRLCMFCGSD